MTVDPNTGEVQKCFVSDDGFMRCNFIMRKGVPSWTRSGKWWRFPVRFWRRKTKKATDTIVVAPVLKLKSS